jgi:hypothetical protein
MVPFVVGTHELKVGFDEEDLRAISTALRTHALSDPVTPTDRLGPGGESLFARPESCGGMSAFLAFWPLSAGDAELRQRLLMIARDPEFGYWFRSARALVGYSARLHENRESATPETGDAASEISFLAGLLSTFRVAGPDAP